MWDVIVIGAGISGCFIAHELSKYECRVLLIDKESDVANESTMANSAIIHAGEDPKDGTLKAELNVKGSRMYEQICKDLKVEYRKTSAFVAATNAEEVASIEELQDRAKRRGIPSEMLGREEAIAKEPQLSDQVIQVLELPTTAVIYPWEVANALAEEAVINGVEVRLSEEVSAIEKRNAEGFLIKTNHGEYTTRYVINAAGVFADRIAEMVMGKAPFQITARRGEYYVTDRLKKPFVSRVIYPAPSQVGKGILSTPTVHGNLLMGPDSVPIEEKDNHGCTRQGLDYVRTGLSKTVKNPPFDKVVRNFAGLRASGNRGDFYIKEEENIEGFVQVACIDSPGLSCAPAIAKMVVEDIILAKCSYEKKKDWHHRRPPVVLREMTDQEKNEMVKVDSRYGKIACRCEQVTEGEIVDCINRPMGAKTVKGVKKRVRPGMGRCQGGFCEPLVVEILARELGVDQKEICYDSPGSELFLEEI